MEAVEGRYRQYVEHTEAQVYKVEIIEYGVEGGVAGLACHHQAKKYEHGNKSQHEVHSHACQRYYYLVPSWVLEVACAYGHRLCPAEAHQHHHYESY